jgi:hypothetical protein
LLASKWEENAALAHVATGGVFVARFGACVMKWQAEVVLILLSIVAINAGAQSSTEARGRVQQTQARGYWVDTSGLMWAGKDDGKDVSWHGAMNYCRNLRLAGYSDWRLATIYELQDIYDAYLETPGLAGPGKGRAFTWHVEGGLLLSGDEWSSTRRLDDRGHPSGYPWYFDFNEGKQFDVDDLYAGHRALCVRRSETPVRFVVSHPFGRKKACPAQGAPRRPDGARSLCILRSWNPVHLGLVWQSWPKLLYCD